MQLILFLSISITAVTLKKYENGLLDELNEWNPSWKKGIQCAAFGSAGRWEGSGIDGSGVDTLDTLVDFGDGMNTGTETYGYPTLQTADFNDSTSGISFFQALDVRLCLVEMLNVIETKKILSDWMMTVVESVLPGKWINISINVKINEFNQFSDQSVASKNALLEISLSGEYHDSLAYHDSRDGERTPEFLDQVLFDIQEAIDFVVQSGSSPSSNVTINSECRPIFSTSNLSISSSEIQTSATDNMITYPYEDLDNSSLFTDTVTDISTTNADKTDTLSTIANRDGINLPTTNVYPLDENNPDSQTLKVENIEDSSSANQAVENELSWEKTTEDSTTSAVSSTMNAPIAYGTSTSEGFHASQNSVVSTIDTEYSTEVDVRLSTTESTFNEDISAISFAATTDSLENELSWETTREDKTTSSPTTSDSSYTLNVQTTDYYPEITLLSTESISDETMSAAITYETSTSEGLYAAQNSVMSTIDGSEYSTEFDDLQSTTASMFSKDISTIPSLAATTELIALTTDITTTSGSVTDGPLQTTYSPSRVYYLSEPRCGNWIDRKQNFPWLVTIVTSAGESLSCNGVLVNCKSVLINGCGEKLLDGNITLLFGQDRIAAQISRTVEQVDFFMESVAIAFFDDPIIDEVAYEKGFIEPICLDENPGTR